MRLRVSLERKGAFVSPVGLDFPERYWDEWRRVCSYPQTLNISRSLVKPVALPFVGKIMGEALL